MHLMVFTTLLVLVHVAVQAYAAEHECCYSVQPSGEQQCNPWPLIVKNGQKFQLLCSASLPQMSTHYLTDVTWFKSHLTSMKNTQIVTSNSTIMEKHEHTQHGLLAIESSVTVTNVTRKDVGCYWCAIAVSMSASTEDCYQLQPTSAFCLFPEDHMRYKSVPVCEAIPHDHSETNCAKTTECNRWHSSHMLPAVRSNEDDGRLKRETVLNMGRSNHLNSSHVSHGDKPTQGMTIGLLIGIIICALLFVAIVVMLAAIAILCGKKTTCQHIQDSGGERKVLTQHLRQPARSESSSERQQYNVHRQPLPAPIGAYYLLQVAGDQLELETDGSLSHHQCSPFSLHTLSTSPSNSLLLTPSSIATLSQHVFPANMQMNDIRTCSNGSDSDSHDNRYRSTVGEGNSGSTTYSNGEKDYDDQSGSSGQCSGVGAGAETDGGSKTSAKLHHYHVLEKPCYSNWTVISNELSRAGEHADAVKKEKTTSAQKMLEIAEEGNYEFDPAFVLQLKAELGSRSAGTHSTFSEPERSPHYAQLDWSAVKSQNPYTNLTSRKS